MEPIATAIFGQRKSDTIIGVRAVWINPGAAANRCYHLATMELFEARIIDLEAAAALFDAYRQFYRYPPDFSACREYLRERISRAESRIFLVSDAGQTIGFMQLYPSFSSLSLKPVWILYDLFVAPDARKRGVARLLLSQAQTLAGQTRASEVTLATAIDNRAAQQLYERMGWNRDDEFYYYNLVV